METQVVHLDLDTFFVSVERLKNPSLIGKPVIVGGTSDRGVVASCSYEARAFGIHAAMPARQARYLCPNAIFVRGDYEDYSKFSHMVTEIITEKVPLFEKASIDEHYVDMTGMDKFHGTYSYMHELRLRIIKETGLPISFGLSPNKTVSKIATGIAKPNGEKQVLQHIMQEFLDPLPINKIPMVGEKSYRRLRDLGISTIFTLRQMPAPLLVNVLGDNGRVIWERANGIDHTPVIPYSEQKSISTERTFDKDTIDVVTVKSILTNMVCELTHKLRVQQKLTACITVKIRYSNFDTESKQKRIPYTSSDHILIKEALLQFDQLYQRRMLIRLVGVRVSHLVHGTEQLDMFEDRIELHSLYQALDKIKLRYGEEKITRASGLNTHRQ
ncbi:MAG: DNA polymerase IV [Bacteroidota bacterium]